MNSSTSQDNAGPPQISSTPARSGPGAVGPGGLSVSELDVFSCPLDGISLIEASAGTGKTWNICGLYLRLLLERRLEVQGILVVTFTKAATAELRERIRQRIVDTLAFLHGGASAAGDPFVPRLVGTLRSARRLDDAEMVTRLELALATFDEAAIFTIHGFCQRALSDTPFTAQMPMAMELLQDDSELVQEAANDFWRRRVAGDTLSPALATHLVKRKDSPEKFARLLKRHLAKSTATPKWPRGIEGIDSVADVDTVALSTAHATARAIWLSERETIVQSVLAALPALKANIYKADSLTDAASAWDTVLQGHDAVAALEVEPEKIDLLGQARLQAGTKKSQTTPSHAFFDAAQTLLDVRASAGQAVKIARLRLLRDLLAQAGAALRAGKRQRRVVAFDDMLFNLHERLTGGDAPWLAGLLRERFPAALIDEFQDTDPLQFAIFKTVYGAGTHPLFLVGDPKQAIYSFRNADLHTYLQARAQSSAEYTLVDNQRSTGPLLDALNGLFCANPQAFMLPGLDYRKVGLGTKSRKVLVDATQPRAPLQVWTLPNDAASGVPMMKKDAQQAVVQAITTEIARLLAAAQRGEITLDGKPLRAGDVAVLVRSHAEGSLVRQALSMLDVGSVELSQASIFRSPDAEELDRVLAAVLEPAREGRLKTVLCTEVMGLDAAAVDALIGDESKLLATVQRFVSYRETWLQRGVGFMLRQWLAAEHVAERMLVRGDGERRLTNLLHLIECLHQAAAAHPAPDALLRWLQEQGRDERADDATQLRLESDQNLVQIVTIHKSKGLEYDIVFCPFLWNGRLGGFPDGLDGVEYHDDDGHAVIDYCKDFEGEFDEADVKARVKLEASAESLRLIYVALTRAVHRCVLVAGCYRVKGKSTSATESTHSLLNWLVAGAGQSPPAWFESKNDPATIAAAWHRLATRAGPHLAVSPLPIESGTPVPATRPLPEMFEALTPPRHMPPGWWIGSYSGLVSGWESSATHEQAAADHDLRVGPTEASATTTAVRLDDDDILRFPRGPAAGVCLHSVFERIDFSNPAGWPSAITAALRSLHADGPAVDSGPASNSDLWQAQHVRMLQGMLADVLATALPVGTNRPLVLSDLPLNRRLTELEFHLPSHRLEAAALNERLSSFGYAVPRLAFTALRGFLKGFIDLVFEHDGRFFILDWKSNHLGDTPTDYARAPLAKVMAEQGYHLQYLLYSVALDRYLRRRLPDYRPQQHFGGVLYLFVRGVRPGWTTEEGLPTGLFFHRPTPAVIESLSALFGPVEVLA